MEEGLGAGAITVDVPEADGEMAADTGPEVPPSGPTAAGDGGIPPDILRAIDKAFEPSVRDAIMAEIVPILEEGDEAQRDEVAEFLAEVFKEGLAACGTLARLARHFEARSPWMCELTDPATLWRKQLKQAEGKKLAMATQKKKFEAFVRADRETAEAIHPKLREEFDWLPDLPPPPPADYVLDVQARHACMHKILQAFSLDTVEWRDYNVISTHYTSDEVSESCRAWAQRLGQRDAFRALVPQLFSLLKRSGDWKDLAGSVNNHYRQVMPELGFTVSPKFLFYILFIHADDKLRPQILEAFATTYPVPVVYAKCAERPEQPLSYEVCAETFALVEPKSTAVVSFGIGEGAVHPRGKSELLNQCFAVNFATGDSSVFSLGSIDMHFDLQFQPSRNLCIADVHGPIPPGLVPNMFGIFDNYIVHVDADDLASGRGGVLDDLLAAVRVPYTPGCSRGVVLLIRDADQYIGRDSETDQTLLFATFSGLAELKSTGCHLDVIALRNLKTLTNNVDHIKGFEVQPCILRSVFREGRPMSLTPTNYLDRFLGHFPGHDVVGRVVNDRVAEMLQSLSRFQDNFMVPELFPALVLLGDLRRCGGILRDPTASEGKVQSAKKREAECKEKLQQVELTPAARSFFALLRDEHSFQVTAELARKLRVFGPDAAQEQRFRELSEQLLKVRRLEQLRQTKQGAPAASAPASTTWSGGGGSGSADNSTAAGDEQTTPSSASVTAASSPGGASAGADGTADADEQSSLPGVSGAAAASPGGVSGSSTAAADEQTPLPDASAVSAGADRSTAATDEQTPPPDASAVSAGADGSTTAADEQTAPSSVSIAVGAELGGASADGSTAAADEQTLPPDASADATAVSPGTTSAGADGSAAAADEQTVPPDASAALATSPGATSTGADNSPAVADEHTLPPDASPALAASLGATSAGAGGSTTAADEWTLLPDTSAAIATPPGATSAGFDGSTAAADDHTLPPDASAPAATSPGATSTGADASTAAADERTPPPSASADAATSLGATSPGADGSTAAADEHTPPPDASAPAATSPGATSTAAADEQTRPPTANAATAMSPGATSAGADGSTAAADEHTPLPDVSAAGAAAASLEAASSGAHGCNAAADPAAASRGAASAGPDSSTAAADEQTPPPGACAAAAASNGAASAGGDGTAAADKQTPPPSASAAAAAAVAEELLDSDSIAMELQMLEAHMRNRRVSVEHFWRELLAVYEHNPDHIQEQPPDSHLAAFIERGEAFELLDGDNLQVAKQTLDKVLTRYKGKRVLVLSVLGPQSSGKSTLLNYLFGCKFSTSVGRCTKGIYAACVKAEGDGRFPHPAGLANDPGYDVLLILDTEGLQSVEKNDPEFDRKVCLFCLAVSQAVLINVKGELGKGMHDLLQICVLSLHELRRAKTFTPEVFMCFNQNPAGSGEEARASLMPQLRQIAHDVLEANPEAKDVIDILQFTPDRVVVLGSAFSKRMVEANNAKGVREPWIRLVCEHNFAYEVSRFASELKRALSERARAMDENRMDSQYKQILAWLDMAHVTWETLQNFPDFFCFADIKSLKQDRCLRAIANKIEMANLLDRRQHHDDKHRKLVETYGTEVRRKGDTDSAMRKAEVEIEQYFVEIRSRIEEAYTREHDKHCFGSEVLQKYRNASQNRVDSYEKEMVHKVRTHLAEKKMERDKEVGVAELERFQQDMIKEWEGKVADPEQLRESVTEGFDKEWKSQMEKLEQQVKEQASRLSGPVWVDMEREYRQQRQVQQKQHCYTILPGVVMGRAERLKRLQHMIETDGPEALVKEVADIMKAGEETLFRFVADPDTSWMSKPAWEVGKTGGEYLCYDQVFHIKVLHTYVDLSKVPEAVDMHGVLEDLTRISRKPDQAVRRAETVGVLSEFLDLGWAFKVSFRNDVLKAMEKPHEAWFSSTAESTLNRVFGKYGCFSYEARRAGSPVSHPLVQTQLAQGVLDPRSLDFRVRRYLTERRAREARLVFEKAANAMDNIPSDWRRVDGSRVLLEPKLGVARDALEWLADPRSQAPECTVTRQMQQLAKEEMDWERVFRDLFDEVAKELQAKTGEGGSSARTSAFSVAAMKNLAARAGGFLKNRVEAGLRPFGLVLDNSALGLMNSAVLLYAWHLIMRGMTARSSKNFQDFDKDRAMWLSYVLRMVSSNPREKSKAAAEKLVNSIKERVLGRMNEEAKAGVRTRVAKHNLIFDRARIIEEADKVFAGSDPEQVILYVTKQVDYLRTHMFEPKWNKVFNEARADEASGIRKEHADRVTALRSWVQKLAGELRDIDGKLATELFSVQGVEEIFKKDSSIVNTASYKYCYAMLKGQVRERWSTQVVVQGGTWEVSAKDLPSSPPPPPDVTDLIVQESLMEVPCISTFIAEVDTKLVELRTWVDNEWAPAHSPAELEVDDVMNQYIRTCIGCDAECPHCGRKCDEDPDASMHKHSCKTFGHQVRGMNGIKDEMNNAVPITCDEMEPSMEIILPGGTREKWHKVCERYPDWEFLDPDRNSSQSGRRGNIQKYQSCWTQHGEAFCTHFAPMSFVSGDMRNMKFHYIFCLDESGSMAGADFEAAKGAILRFVRKANERADNSRVTVINFATTARYAVKGRALSENIGPAITFNDGGTEFGPPLRLAIETAREAAAEFPKIPILFYTDGAAAYPGAEVQEMAALMVSMPNKIDFWAICDDDDPFVLRKMCDVLSTPERLLKGVTPDQLSGRLAQVLSEMHMPGGIVGP